MVDHSPEAYFNYLSNAHLPIPLRYVVPEIYAFEVFLVKRTFLVTTANLRDLRRDLIDLMSMNARFKIN